MRHALLLLAAVLLGAAAPLAGQSQPVAPGERLEYRVKLGPLRVGRAVSSVDVDTVGGRSLWRMTFRIQGGIPFARVDDRYTSWFDPEKGHSVRFRRSIDEPGHKSLVVRHFRPEDGIWWQEGAERSEWLASDLPLDDVSVLYHTRTLPLEPGDTVMLRRYYKESGNPVVLIGLQYDRVRVPAGEYDALRVRPIIQTDGLFGKGGRAEVWMSTGPARLPVLIRADVPIIGHLSMELVRVHPAPESDSNDGDPPIADAEG